MILGAKGELWPVLKNSDHFPRLKDLIKTTSKDCTTLLDLGCGAAELSRLFPEYFYVGADLKQILENVSMKMNPGKNYIDFDIYNNETCSFINEYDIVVMNALIDVLEHPLFGLKNVLSNSQKYVIIGEPLWTRDEFKSHLKEFAEIYKDRPIEDNKGGMKAAQLFYAWFAAKKLQPKVIIESGVWYGQGTWVLNRQYLV